VVVLAIAVSACGSNGGSTTARRAQTVRSVTQQVTTVTKTTSTATQPRSATDTSAASSDPKCLPVDLGIHFVSGQGATAMFISTFDFINVSPHECHLVGYPGAAVYDRAGRELRVKVQRESVNGRPPKLVRLPPGGRASFQTITAAFRPTAGHCVTTYNLRFTPPNDYSTLEIRHQLLICRAIAVGPVQKAR